MLINDHVITVPLDHRAPDGRIVEVYAREIAANGGRDLPYLVFLQGGPGNEAPRPTAQPPSPSWLERALQDYRVILLDQRGTGRSTPYGAPGAGDAEWLAHFRADAIVQDAESLREHLGARKWSLLGQSFGGFCSLHYLTVAPDSLREVYFTGGLPPVGHPVDDVYSAAYDMMRTLNRRYHKRFPEDAARLRELLDRCDAGDVRTLEGHPISRRLMRTIGHRLGMDGGAESVHHLLELDFTSPAFRHDAAAMLPFGSRNPLYAILHESSYSDGGATRWSAHRVQPGDFEGESVLLTAEHIFPWHFGETGGLRPYAQIARELAEYDWPRLYDAEVLAQVDVPCAAVIYADDPYVLRQFSEETADLLPGMRRWLTDEYLHNGLRTDGGRVLDRLIMLARG
ncbi:alpha/beta fold hydrolase [Mycolicibacterium sp. P9-64]|uniref:alpha/beta fold hydrolase n=1 Tax=Mycolicibacterium sp. P9-64 TaxID=2024612 RepID=UPI0011ECDB52|nr:alpha/beta fold hydrolase [Mycolicibacterium sp. P9-64]KAA0084661.1 alpha/beta fold hydrolase [Mycolicibacterium sp. P9-64]